MNNKKSVLFWFTFSILCVLTLLYWFINDSKLDKENLNLSFAGKVKKITYDIKQYPSIIVDDSTYYIGSGYDTDHQIEIGDSLIKRKGSNVYILIKLKTHKVIKFTK